MDTEPYRLPDLTVQSDEDGCRVDQVVTFPQFIVRRWRIEAERQFETATPGGDQYHLIHVLSGDGNLVLPDGTAHGLKAGDALLLGAALGPYRVDAAAGGALTCVVASPRQDGAAR
jgi:mannose-6-phosphate isomerase class I